MLFASIEEVLPGLPSDDMRWLALAAFTDGAIAGMTLFAHWKDGVEYVGTCGKTLNQVIAETMGERDRLAARYGLDGAPE